MKIVDKRVNETPTFGNLKPGDCFAFYDEFFMVCKEVQTNDCEFVNAVSLKDYSLVSFFDDEKITPIQNASLIFE